MATLFVARDAVGRTRFVGEVPRGAACGCFCPVCAAPLVAKQGEALEWHFAHEGGTERPECRAGATNLLRRLVLEELERGGLDTLPLYSVPHPVPGRALIEWAPHSAGELEVLAVRGPQTPSARLPLRECGMGLVFVCIDREPAPAAPGPDQAALVARCLYPADGQIRTEAQARDFVRSALSLQWAALPDFDGRLAAARAEARAFSEMMQRERQRQAGALWAAKRRVLQHATPPRELPSLPLTGPAAGLVRAGAEPEWAPGLLPESSIHYRAMDDGSQWVCFQHAPNEWRLRPVPDHHDGWDESFPPGVAVMEGEPWLRVVDFGKLLLLFNAHATASQIDSDPGVIESSFGK